MLRVVVTDPSDPAITEALAPLVSSGFIELADCGTLSSADAVINAASDAEIVIANSPIDGPPDLFREVPRLLAFVQHSDDTEGIDMRAAGRAGVLVAMSDGCASTASQVSSLVEQAFPDGSINPGMAMRLKVRWAA